jgi:hypothetical protein
MHYAFLNVVLFSGGAAWCCVMDRLHGVHAMLPHGRLLHSMHRSHMMALQLVVELVQCDSWAARRRSLSSTCLLLQLHGMVPPCSSAAFILYPMQ